MVKPIEEQRIERRDLIGVGLPPRKPPEPVPPQPPPAEPFPGFQVASADITKQLFESGKRTQQTSNKLASIQRKLQFNNMIRRHPALATTAAVLGGPFLGLIGFFAVTGAEGTEENLAVAQAEFNAAQVEYNRFTRRQDILLDLSAFVNDPELGIRSAEDFLNIIPEGYFDDSDADWLREVFSRIEPMLAPELPDDAPTGIEEARKEVLDIILSEPPLEMRGVHNLTVDELIKSFVVSVPELPEGMTMDDLRAIIGKQQFPEEDMQLLDDLSAYTAEKLQQWETEVAYQEILKTGIAHIGVPDLTPTEFLKMTFTQPMLATVELLEKYFNILPRPLAASAIRFMSRQRKDPEAFGLEALYQQYRDVGVDSWEANSLAYQNWGTNIWLKMAIEIPFDPTSYIGLGIATKLFKPIPYLGKFVGAVESGWLRAADVPFMAARKLRGVIPKTVTAQASAISRQAYRDTRAYINRLYPNTRNLVGVTPKEFEDAIKFAVGSVFETPQETGNMAVRVGRYFLEQDFIDEATVGRWLKRLGKDADITIQRLADVNDSAQMLLLKAMVPKEAAARILNTLGIDTTKSLVTKMTKLLGEYKTTAIKGSTDFLRGKTVREMLDSMLTNINDLYYRKYTSPIYRHMQQAGQATGWISRASDKIVRNNILNAIDRQFTAPIANQWLLFTNLGPMNYAEGMMRSWLGGGELLYPKRFSGVSEAVRLFDDLPNMPFELVMAERELGRMDIAIVRPKTGETIVFMGGRIPFITRNVKIPGTNRVLAKTINIGGKDYQLGSLQSWHDLWGDMATKQRAWSLMVQYKKALREVATPEVEMIDDIVARNRPLLAEMTTMAKADITDIERIAWQDATRGPAMVRGHADVPVLELERRKISKEISKIMDKHTDIRSVTKHGIREEVLDGTMLKDIPGRVAVYKETERELMVVGLKNEIDVIEGLVKEMASVVPETSDDILRHIGAISDMADAVADRISDVRMVTRKRAAGFKEFTKAKDDFNLASGELLSDFMGVSRDSIDEMLANLRKVVVERRVVAPVVRRAEIPKGWQVEVGIIKVEPGLEEVVTGKAMVDWKNKKIIVRDTTVMNDFAVMNEEIAHIRLEELPSDVKQTAISAFEVAAKYEPIEIRSQFARREGFGQEYGNYLTDTSSVIPEIAAVFEKYFPSVKPIPAVTPEFLPELLTPEHLASFDTLSNAIRLRNANLLATRDKARQFATRTFADTPPGKGRNDAFWNKFEANNEELIWAPYRQLDEELLTAIEDAKIPLMKNLGVEPDIPSLVPEIPDRLAPTHVAYLLGVTGDDLNKGLTKVMGAQVTIRTKESFTNYVYRRARKVSSNVGKTPEDIGFTKQAIGDVYDQMWDNLGIDSRLAAEEALLPTMQQLDEVAVELERLVGTSKIPDSDYLKYKQYFNTIADELEQTPMYKVPEVVVPRFPSGGTKATKSEWLLSKSRLAELYVSSAEGKTSRVILDELSSDLLKKLKFEYSELARAGGIKISDAMPLDVSDLIDDLARATRTSDKMIAFDKLISTLHGAPGVPRIDFMLPRLEMIVEDGIETLRVIAEESIETVRAMVTRPLARPSPSADWLAKRETAMTQARQMHELAFPTYDEPNFVDSTMRMIFPFWTYESFRWQWLPRTYLRTPGTATAVGRYMDYSDQGYIPIGNTDIQMNPLRGTIFMGGFRRLYMRDYPEYYDAFPGMEVLDYIGRVGFYPGAQVMLPIAIWGAAGDKQPHLLEVAPAWIKSVLDAARAIAPETAGKVIDHFFPDRMKDYYTMLTLAAAGEEAQDLWRKKQPGNIGLSPEEEKLWLRAEAKAIGWKGVLFEQTGMLRLRPDEYTQLNLDMMGLIEEMTGVPVEVQEEIRRRTPVTGKRFADYFFLSELQRRIVYNSEAYRRFQGVTTPLFPSAWQEEDVRTADYYDKVETLFEDARHKGIFDEQGNLVQQSIADITKQWIDGVIGPDQWSLNHGDALAHASAAALEMGKLVYPDVPKTLEEREARLKERGVPTITYGPDRELLWKYYEIKPELKWDWEAERMTYDYDLYYAKIDMMIDTLQGEFKQELLDTIQFKWIGMERLQWQINQEYIRPYNGLRQVVLEQYDPEQIKLIRRYEVARGKERDEIRAIEGPEGRKLIAGYTARLREARQRYRLLDPITDAWLNFFGKTDTLLSKEATTIYDSITKEYMTPEMYK